MADTVITFDSPIPAGFSLTGTGTVTSGSIANITAQPNNTAYLTVAGGQSSTITASQGYKSVSFDWGSPDTYNTLKIFDTLGGLIASFTGGTAPGIVANGATTQSFSYTLAQGQAPGGIGALQFLSSTNAFELDNVKFATAVPEPSMALLFAAAVGALVVGRRFGTAAARS